MKEEKRMALHRMYYDSPIGGLCLEDDGEALTALYPVSYLSQDNRTAEDSRASELLKRTCDELEDYFLGRRTEFDLPLHPQGTSFQKKVWNALREIPYGETRSYADIAVRIGQPQACRAVGGANNKNRILILIPCHRVIGKNGSLTGFGCGMDAKEHLLKLEAAHMSGSSFSGTVSPAETYLVSEALAEYAHRKQQGDYTLEDYFALPEERRVELIDGVIYDMASPTLIHQAIGDSLQALFNHYIREKHGTCRAFTSPVDVQLDCDDRTMVQPDVLILCDLSKVRKGRVYGAPDLVVEVLSPATSRKDRSLKLSKYKRAGVREYWIVDPKWKTVLVYAFKKGDTAALYGFDAIVPVGIYDGECRVDFAQIYEEIRILYEIDPE